MCGEETDLEVLYVTRNKKLAKEKPMLYFFVGCNATDGERAKFNHFRGITRIFNAHVSTVRFTMNVNGASCFPHPNCLQTYEGVLVKPL